MELHKNQQVIYNKVKELLANGTMNNYIFCDSKAGTGKSTLAKKIIVDNQNISSFYTAFNKPIVTEFANKVADIFNCEVRTTHSLAYKYIIRSKGYEITNFFPLFNKKIFKGNTKVNYRFFIQELYELWLISDKTSIDEFINKFDIEKASSLIKSTWKKKEIEDYKKILKTVRELTLNHEIGITHNGYLKEMQLAMHNGEIKIYYDLIILDECNDLNPVTFDIIKMMDAKVKLLIGDKFQEIYQFNGTVNAFKEYSHMGENYQLTDSFRCSSKVAKIAETFVQGTLEKDFKFNGLNIRLENNDIALITRTNSQLIRTSLTLMSNKIHFKYTKDMKEMFLTLIGINNTIHDIDTLQDKVSFRIKSVIKDFKNKNIGSLQINPYNYKYVLDDLIEAVKKAAYNQKHYKYIDILKEKANDDVFTELDKIEVEVGLTLFDFDSLFKSITTYAQFFAYSAHDANMIILGYTLSAKDLSSIIDYTNKTVNNSAINLTLTTAHSCKGLEWDNVIIHPTYSDDILEQVQNGNKAYDEYMLYYVAITRAKNKVHFPRNKEEMVKIIEELVNKANEDIL
jgi:superfamily I DNA/RNA helicase